MRLVHLARHGAHGELGGILSGRSEIALSARGRAEAEWLAERLRGVPLGAVRASPRARTMATATLAAAPHGLAVEPCPALDEIDFGAWTGRAFAVLEEEPEWRRWNEARGSARPPGGETVAEVVARAWPALHYDGTGDLLCVTHCDVIRALVATCLGLPIDRMLGFECDPASLTTLALFEDGGARLVTLNERPR